MKRTVTLVISKLNVLSRYTPLTKSPSEVKVNDVNGIEMIVRLNPTQWAVTTDNPADGRLIKLTNNHHISANLY